MTDIIFSSFFIFGHIVMSCISNIENLIRESLLNGTALPETTNIVKYLSCNFSIPVESSLAVIPTVLIEYTNSLYEKMNNIAQDSEKFFSFDAMEDAYFSVIEQMNNANYNIFNIYKLMFDDLLQSSTRVFSELDKIRIVCDIRAYLYTVEFNCEVI